VTDLAARARKVPLVTLLFWVTKIAATTLGETGGDAVTMSMGLGYLVGTALFAAAFLVVAAAQIRARRLHPALYWATILASTMVGTTLADYADRSLGLGYPGGVALLAALLVCSLLAWRVSLGTVSIDALTTPRAEAHYWVTILFSQTLGTALGDWSADSAGLGYLGSAAIYAALLLVLALLYWRTRVSRTLLFWVAFVLTRPFGAVLGDFMDKPLADGGLALSRYSASFALLAIMAACVWFDLRRGARRRAGAA
jgi:uncharacterized membrane-anchored protein